jgi:hypothetical protein
MEYTAITKNVEDWWIGWIEEIPGVNCQEKIHNELLGSLKITIKEAIEFNRAVPRHSEVEDILATYIR